MGWPNGMPRIDGVMLRYNACDVRSTDKLEELRGTYICLLSVTLSVGEVSLIRYCMCIECTVLQERVVCRQDVECVSDLRPHESSRSHICFPMRDTDSEVCRYAMTSQILVQALCFSMPSYAA